MGVGNLFSSMPPKKEERRELPIIPLIHKVKTFPSLDEAIAWLNTLKDLPGPNSVYNVDSVYESPKGVHVVLSGYGGDWDKV